MPPSESKLSVVDDATAGDVSLDDVVPPETLSVEQDVRPALRDDLTFKQGEPGLVMVKAPEAATAFPIYELEWKVAQLMDGRRSLAEIAAEATKKGVPATTSLVRSFARELNGYRFLVVSKEAVAALRQTGSRAPAAEQLSDEEQQLLRTATAMHQRGELDSAVNYLLAAIEINPGNHQARALLRDYQAQITESPRKTRDDFAPVETGGSKRGVAIAVASLLVAALGLGVGVLALTRTDEPTTTSVTAAPTPTPSPAAATAAPAATTTPKSVPLRIKAGETRKVFRATGGDIVRFSVQNGAALKAGDTVAHVYKKSDYQKLLAAEIDMKKRSARAERDQVYRYFWEGEKKKLEKYMREIKGEPVLATQAGAFKRVAADDSSVQAGEALYWLADSSTLTANIPNDALPFPLEQVRCRLAGEGSATCTVALSVPPDGGKPKLTVVIDNGAGTLRADDWLNLELYTP